MRSAETRTKKPNRSNSPDVEATAAGDIADATAPALAVLPVPPNRRNLSDKRCIVLMTLEQKKVKSMFSEMEKKREKDAFFLPLDHFVL